MVRNMRKVIELNLTIGKAIRVGLVRKRLTQEELAKIVGSTQRSISSYVNGNAQPPLDILVNICRVLEINLNHILHLQDYECPYRLLIEPQEIEFLEIFESVPNEKRDEYLQMLMYIRSLLTT